MNMIQTEQGMKPLSRDAVVANMALAWPFPVSDDVRVALRIRERLLTRPRAGSFAAIDFRPRQAFKLDPPRVSTAKPAIRGLLCVADESYRGVPLAELRG